MTVIEVDFAGPLYAEGSGFPAKVYIVIIACAVPKAIHLEMLNSVSTDCFLKAFRRFVTRRGMCSTIYSKNAKTQASCFSQK